MEIINDSQKENEPISPIKINNNILLINIHQYLYHLFPHQIGLAYMLTDGNSLDSDFLLQTPNVWGKTSSEVPIFAGFHIAKQITALIETAEQFIDITTLQPFPDGAFFRAIQDGLEAISKKNKKITVRILVGWPPLQRGSNQHDYLESLIQPFESSKNLSIYVAAQRNNDLTWNHSKIIAVDGKKAIIGGQNLWEANYLGPYPVHDLNVKLNGPMVFFFHKFIDVIWQNVATYKTSTWKSVFWSAATGIQKKYLTESVLPNPINVGKIKILGAGRYWDSNSRAADKAFIYCFENAFKSIYISQMDLLFGFGKANIHWTEGINAIVNAIVRGVTVKIVISDNEGKASATLDESSNKSTSYSYSTQVKTFDAICKILNEVSKKDRIIRGKLEVAVLRFGPSSIWRNGWEFANHAKFTMIDEQLFYIGSENLYPSDLIEYGVFIEDVDAVTKIKNDYWNPLWDWSKTTILAYP